MATQDLCHKHVLDFTVEKFVISNSNFKVVGVNRPTTVMIMSVCCMYSVQIGKVILKHSIILDIFFIHALKFECYKIKHL